MNRAFKMKSQISRAQEIINAISKGEQKEKYAEWAKNSNAQIRYTLARHGYYPDIFIKDENENIRIETVAAHPEYIQYMLNDQNQYETVNNILSKERDIDIEVLKQHIEDLKTFNDEYFREDMELKLKSMLHEPTPIELTMTRYQLYLAKSPFWARDFPPEYIYDILNMVEDDIEDDIEDELKYLEDELKYLEYDNK